MPNVTVIAPHDAASVETVIAEAHRIVEELDLSPDLVEAAFREACRLLGARHVLTVDAPQAISLPPQLRHGLGGG